MEYTIALEGGRPWGVRLTGGSDFGQYVCIGKVWTCLSYVLRAPWQLQSVNFYSGEIRHIYMQMHVLCILLCNSWRAQNATRGAFDYTTVGLTVGVSRRVTPFTWTHLSSTLCTHFVTDWVTYSQFSWLHKRLIQSFSYRKSTSFC